MEEYLRNVTQTQYKLQIIAVTATVTNSRSLPPKRKKLIRIVAVKIVLYSSIQVTQFCLGPFLSVAFLDDIQHHSQAF
eukprot:6465255-Amphidinium_carterae.1